MSSFLFLIPTYRLLMCERQESRGGEWVLRKMLAPMEYMAPGLATTPTSTLAKAMIHVTAAPIQEPFHLIDGKSIHRLTVVKEKKKKCSEK